MKILAAATVWLRRIVDIALITLILVVLAGVVLGKIVPLTGRETLAIGGRSMEPAIPVGVGRRRRARRSRAPGRRRRRLDAGGRGNAIFTHRIEAVVDRADGRYVRTKGDANPDADPTLVKASAIIGRVELSIPYMGYLLALLSIPTGVIFVVGLAATLLAIAWLLESLEPIPGADRRRGAVPSTWAATAGGPFAGPSSGPALPPLPVLRPAPGPLVLALVAPGTRTPLVRDPAGRASLERPGADRPPPVRAGPPAPVAGQASGNDARVSVHRPRRAVAFALAIGLSPLIAGAAGAASISLARFTDASTATRTVTTDTLDPPTALSATGGTTAVSLAWTPTVDTYPTGYEVRRATVSGGPYTTVATVTPRTAASTTNTPPANGT